MNEIKIDGKEYKYFLERNHVYMFGKILGKLDFDIDFERIKTLNDAVLMIRMVQNALLKFDSTDKESLEFIASVYKVEPVEILKIGLINEIKLWENLFMDEYIASFFSRAFGSKVEEIQEKITKSKKKKT